MLPPIPHSLVPVTVQQDVVKPRPEIPPVTASAESSKESGVSLDKRHPQEAEMLLREEQRRRQRRHGYTQSVDDCHSAAAIHIDRQVPAGGHPLLYFGG